MYLHQTVVQCPFLDEPISGTVSFSDDTNVRSRATYSCNPGFTIDRQSGDIVRVCGPNGRWSGDAPVCICKYLRMML